MHRVMNGNWAHRWLVGTALAWLACAPEAAPAEGAYKLPMPEATDWTVLVFGARLPAALSDKPVPFTVEAKWEAGGKEGGQSLSGKATRFATTQLSLTVPGECSSLIVSLNWDAVGVDLDIGLICASSGLRLAPIFTVLKPERVRFDAQTAALYNWLAAEHPDWWKGYPFWAEVEPAPKRDRAEASQ
jgi:hypothetical protein